MLTLSTNGAAWHSEVIDPLARRGVDFVETISTGDKDIPRSFEIGEVIARRTQADTWDTSLLAGVNSFKRDFIIQAFTRDTAVAQDLDASVHVSTLFEPMLERHGFDAAASGTTALGVAVPNVGRLSWEQIIEFRTHPGAGEARSMLIELERHAAADHPSDSRHYATRIAEQLTGVLFATLGDKKLKLGREVTEEVAKTAISFIPFAGPFIEKAMTGAQLAAEKRAEGRTGIAALMKLRAAST